MRFVKFKIMAGTRLVMMFINCFKLPNLLARTNKPGLFLVFHNSMNMLGFNGVFAMTNKIFFMKI